MCISWQRVSITFAGLPPMREVALTAARLLVVVPLLYSSLAHMEDPFRFAAIVKQYAVLYPAWISIVAVAFPPLLLTLACGLLCLPVAKPSAVLLAGIFTVLVIVQIKVVLSGLEIECGCFPGWNDSEMVGSATILRTATMAVLSGLLAKFLPDALLRSAPPEAR